MVERMTAAQYRAGHLRVAKGDRRRVRGTKPVWVDGIKFHSTKEAKRYGVLKIRIRLGEIRDLKLQVKHKLIGEKGPILTAKAKRQMMYISDFEYFDILENEDVIEDAKGHDTELSNMKRQVMASMGKPVRLV